MHDFQPLRAVFRRRHLLEEPVELRVHVARNVLPLRRQILAVEEHEIILRVGVVRAPAGAGRQLEIALILLLQHAGESVLQHAHADAEALVALLLKLRHQPLVGAGRRHVHGKLERLAGRRIASAGIACLFDQPLRAVGIEAVGVAVVFLEAVDPRRDELLRNLAHAVEEDLVFTLRIESAREGLPQFFVLPEQRVLHVQARVEGAHVRVLLQPDATGAILRREFIRGADDAGEGVLAHAEIVEVALPREEESGDRLAEDSDLHLVEQRQRLACEGADERVLIRGPAGCREGGGAVALVAHEPEALVLVRILVDAERPGADGMPAEGRAAHRLPRRPVGMFLAVVMQGRLARDRRGEVHREPIQDLRIRLLEVEVEPVRVHDFQPRQALAVVEGIAVLFRCGVAFLHAGNVFGEDRGDRALDLGIAQPLEGEMHVFRHHLPTPPAGETRVVVEEDAALQLAAIGDGAVGIRHTLGQPREHARHDLVGIGLEGGILEQAVDHGLEDAAAHLIVGELRIESARRIRDVAVAHEPRRAVWPRLAQGLGIGIVAAACEEQGETDEQESVNSRGTAHGSHHAFLCVSAWMASRSSAARS